MFFARLHLQLLGLPGRLDYELEYLGHHLAEVEARFADHWDDLPPAPDTADVRYVVGSFDAVSALFVVEGRLGPGGVVSIRNIRIVPLPG